MLKINSDDLTCILDSFGSRLKKGEERIDEICEINTVESKQELKSIKHMTNSILKLMNKIIKQINDFQQNKK